MTEQPAREPSIPPPSAEHMAVNLIGWHKCESGEEWFTDVFGFGADMPSLIGLIRRCHHAEAQLDAIVRLVLGKEACPRCNGNTFVSVKCVREDGQPLLGATVPCPACPGTGTRDVLDGLTLVQGVERVVSQLQEEIGCTEAMKEGFGERLWSVEAERDAARAAVVEMREAAAKVAESEAEMRRKREDTHRRDGGEYEARIQGHKSITASAIAAAIRSLPVKEAIGINSRECEPMTPETANALAELARTVRDNDVRKQERERCAAKIEEQSKMLSSMFDDRHEPLCRDLAAAIRSLPVKEG